MSSEAVRQIIESRFDIIWDDRTPISWDNVDYKPQKGTPFIKCVIEQTLSEQKSIQCVRENYLIMFQVFTPGGTGVAPNNVFSDALLAIFGGQSCGNLHFKTGRTERAGNFKEWHQRNVIFDAFYDQQLSAPIVCFGDSQLP